MSKLVIVAIFDRKVGAYNRPFYVRSEGEALRIFGDEINRRTDDNIMNKHPEDYFLAVLGTFDEETGNIEQDAKNIRNHDAKSFIN